MQFRSVPGSPWRLTSLMASFGSRLWAVACVLSWQPEQTSPLPPQEVTGGEGSDQGLAEDQRSFSPAEEMAACAAASRAIGTR